MRSNLIGLLLAATVAASSTGTAADRFTLRVTTAEPARFYLIDSSGRSWAPEGALRYEQRGERHFIVRNGFEIELPLGSYTLIAERGPEYRPFRKTIHGRGGATSTVKVALSRWINMNRLGWYSGDLHNHRRPDDMPLLLIAEDLNLAPTLADWVWDDRQRSAPPNTREAIRQVSSTHVFSVLDKEVERLRAGPGAVDLLGLRSPISFDGYLLHPTNDIFAKEAHAQGAWVDAEKIVWRDMAALVALGHVDFAGIVYNHFNRQDVETETDSWGMIPKSRPEFRTPAGMPLWAMEVYYRFLNCGFRLPVSAGSASGVKAAPLGYNRVYVKVETPFGYETWFRALKAGRSLATNGPMLFLTVDGKGPGHVLRVAENERRRVMIHATVSSQRPMDRLEVIFKGRTVRTVRGRGTLTADFVTGVAEPGWFAARAFETVAETVRFAHTSPVYVEIAGQSGIVREDARFFIDWIDREVAFYRELPGFRAPEHRSAMLALFTSARQVYASLAGGSR
ncbi:MAG TPA: CehA/McbA family metallohydrolase [Bryobacteraceae bacterium]|nr:CehA/McbA family metallohydrolase [Bryobacteraceae bacterium]